jgi:hypothetical protein
MLVHYSSRVDLKINSGMDKSGSYLQIIAKGPWGGSFDFVNEVKNSHTMSDTGFYNLRMRSNVKIDKIFMLLKTSILPIEEPRVSGTIKFQHTPINLVCTILGCDKTIYTEEDGTKYNGLELSFATNGSTSTDIVTKGATNTDNEGECTVTLPSLSLANENIEMPFGYNPFSGSSSSKTTLMIETMNEGYGIMSAFYQFNMHTDSYNGSDLHIRESTQYDELLNKALNKEESVILKRKIKGESYNTLRYNQLDSTLVITGKMFSAKIEGTGIKSYDESKVLTDTIIEGMLVDISTLYDKVADHDLRIKELEEASSVGIIDIASIVLSVLPVGDILSSMFQIAKKVGKSVKDMANKSGNVSVNAWKSMIGQFKASKKFSSKSETLLKDLSDEQVSLNHLRLSANKKADGWDFGEIKRSNKEDYFQDVTEAVNYDLASRIKCTMEIKTGKRDPNLLILDSDVNNLMTNKGSPLNTVTVSFERMDAPLNIGTNAFNKLRDNLPIMDADSLMTVIKQNKNVMHSSGCYWNDFRHRGEDYVLATNFGFAENTHLLNNLDNVGTKEGPPGVFSCLYKVKYNNDRSKIIKVEPLPPRILSWNDDQLKSLAKSMGYEGDIYENYKDIARSFNQRRIQAKYNKFEEDMASTEFYHVNNVLDNFILDQLISQIKTKYNLLNYNCQNITQDCLNYIHNGKPITGISDTELGEIYLNAVAGYKQMMSHLDESPAK